MAVINSGLVEKGIRRDFNENFARADRDADGVDDCDDACPNSESEAEVDDTGCAVADLHDDDGDGVNNGSDACPDTPVGESADATGCSCSQKDADSDGVDDCNDECVSTGAGLTVDADGCAANQLDGDDDGVTNDTDACANTPAGAMKRKQEGANRMTVNPRRAISSGRRFVITFHSRSCRMRP